MTENLQREISTLILRAFSSIKGSTNMAFVGIYSTETYEPLALTDREHVQIYFSMEAVEDQTRKMAVEILPSQIQAIVRHIRTPDNPLTQINIANLRFVCLRTGSSCMTGMSNFNMDTTRASIKDVDKSVFSIIHKHYTSQELFDGFHALQISAILKEEFIIIGMCRSGEESSLKILKTIFEERIHSETNNNEAQTNEAESRNTNVNAGRGKPEIFFPSDSSESGSGSMENGSEVELRHAALSPEERRKLQQKRETSFCEDWRSVTGRSIDALRMIGPFRSEDEFSDRDDRPLIENIESVDISPAENVFIDSENEYINNQEDPKTKDARVIRRPSRATMV